MGLAGATACGVASGSPLHYLLAPLQVEQELVLTHLMAQRLLV
jgi:hypothetical protein